MNWIDSEIDKLVARFGMDVSAFMVALVFVCLLVGLGLSLK